MLSLVLIETVAVAKHPRLDAIVAPASPPLDGTKNLHAVLGGCRHADDPATPVSRVLHPAIAQPIQNKHHRDTQPKTP